MPSLPHSLIPLDLDYLYGETDLCATFAAARPERGRSAKRFRPLFMCWSTPTAFVSSWMLSKSNGAHLLKVAHEAQMLNVFQVSPSHLALILSDFAHECEHLSRVEIIRPKAPADEPDPSEGLAFSLTEPEQLAALLDMGRRLADDDDPAAWIGCDILIPRVGPARCVLRLMSRDGDTPLAAVQLSAGENPYQEFVEDFQEADDWHGASRETKDGTVIVLDSCSVIYDDEEGSDS